MEHKSFSFLVGSLCALFSGEILASVIEHHPWGPKGRPEWAAHPNVVGLVFGAVLVIITIANTFWQERWVARVTEMARERFTNWYVRSAVIGVGIGLLFGFLNTWLTRAHQVPNIATEVFLLGILAVMGATSMLGYYRLQSLARTQRDLLVQAQLAPHFLFNSLSTLKGQIAEEPIEAQATADRLARLFRDLMDMGRETAVPLSREIAFVEAYLGLEKARLGERLQVKIQIPDELEGFPVPPLSLQVLVENAVRHAIAPSVDGGLLTIRASRVPAGLQVVVEDPGTGESPNPGSGRGLQVLRSRLSRSSDLVLQKTPEGHQATLILRKA